MQHLLGGKGPLCFSKKGHAERQALNSLLTLQQPPSSTGLCVGLCL